MRVGGWAGAMAMTGARAAGMQHRPPARPRTRQRHPGPTRMLLAHGTSTHGSCASTPVVQGGVPPALRSWCWPEMSGAAALRTKHPEGHYQDLLAAAAQECVCQRQIELVRGQGGREGGAGRGARV